MLTFLCSYCFVVVFLSFRLLQARPLLTKSVTGSVLYTAGDVICQGIDGTLQK